MNPLPSGLADPLHLDFPVPWKLIAIAAAIFFAVIALVLIRSWLRSRRQAPTKSLPAPVPSAAFDVFGAIEEIRERYVETGSFRLACHELSTLLRRHFERSSGHRYSVLTAGEMRKRVGEGSISRFFGLLAQLQFGRGKPSRDDLDGACDLAVDVVKGNR